MKRVNFYLPVFLLALVLALCLVSPVSADDGSINDPVVITEVQPEAAAEADTPADAVVVESVPVVTRDSGEITVEGDPYFTVGSTTYHFAKDCTGIDNCQESPTPIGDAVDYMETNNLTPSDRKLYIEEDNYEEDVEIDGTADGVKGLTGLVGLGATADDVVIYGSVTVHDMTSGFAITNLTVQNNTPAPDQIAIYMYDNKGTVTLTDVNATAYSDGITDSTGIYIEQTGNVVFNRVDASGSSYQGANINATGSVTITNATFYGNLWATNDGNNVYDDFTPWRTALVITVNGTSAVTLNGVRVSHNGGDGVNIIAPSSLVTVKNSSFDTNGVAWDGEDNPYQVYENYGAGLVAEGNAVTLSNVDVSNNGESGLIAIAFGTFSGDRVIATNNLGTGMTIMTCIWFDGDAPYCDNPGAGTVTFKASAASGNSSDGISIYAKGAVTLYDDFSGWNDGDGFDIDNSDAATAVPVTMTLVNALGNNDNGISIMTRGAVTGTNVHADNNSNDGLDILALGTGAVTFKIDTSGADPYAFNETCNNGNDGYNITAAGAVSLTSFDSYGNGGNGGTIDNTMSASAPVTLSVANTKGTVSGLANNGGYGLQIDSNGVVTIKNLDASGNQDFGALITNIPTVGTAKPNVILSNVNFFNNCAKDGDGNCYDDGNYDHNGLEVQTRGLITVTNIWAGNNYGSGAILNNEIDTATAGVTINASKGSGNSFLGNTWDGLSITTNGPITVTNITASYNGGSGLIAWNLSGTGAVTLNQTGSWSDSYGKGYDGNAFNENTYDGLLIVTRGAVKVAFQEASWNGNSGLNIIAVDGTGAVTVTGRYSQWQNVQGNNDTGIYIVAKGNILLTNVVADDNGGYGAFLNNTSGTGLVTIKYGYFDRNDNGLDVQTTGAINWTYGSADDNFSYGAQLINFTPDLAAKPVVVSYVSTNRNGENGLLIVTKGAVNLTNVESNNNSANEYFIYDGENWTDNLTDDQVWYYSGYTGEILSISVESVNFNPCFSIFSASDGSYVGSTCGTDGSAYAELELPADDEYNIYVWADDGNNLHQYSIAVYDTASVPGDWDYEYSSAAGILIDNSFGTAPVTVNNKTWTPWTSNNSGTDLMIMSSGAVKVSNETFNDSGNRGLYVSTLGAVTLTNIETSVNANTGVFISTPGAVTVKTVRAYDNGSDGYFIDAGGAVKMTDVRASNNDGSGIWAYSGGAAVFSSINTCNNGQYGTSVLTPSTFTLNKSAYNYNWFNGNGADGLAVNAQGKVTITNAYASSNGWWEYDDFLMEWVPSTTAFGINISNTNVLAPQPVVLMDVRGSYNTMDGIQVVTSGAVTVTKVVAGDNQHDGLSIDQSSAPTSAYAIVVSKAVADNNGWHGIYVYGLGNITLSKFDASWNRGDSGVTLNNENGTGFVTILNPSGGVTNNWASFNGDGNGVTIYTRGAVSITGLEVTGNKYDGLYVYNSESPASAPVILNTIVARENGSNGMDIHSNGVVTVNNSWSASNFGAGIYVNTPGNVFISNTGAISNWWEGIYADLGLSGNLTLTNCTWYGNLKDAMAGMFSSNLVFNGGSLIIN